MNLNSLSVGNIVSLAYNTEVITTVIAIEYGGAVQVACNNYTDDIREITGVHLNKETLERFCIPEKTIGNNKQAIISCENEKVYIYGMMLCKASPVQYLHELQNLIACATGVEIVDHKRFLI